jgi:hypothetical protein
VEGEAEVAAVDTEAVADVAGAAQAAVNHSYFDSLKA